MGALLSLPISLLNLLLPFTRPETPIIQDLLHTVILCGSLYYAPQIAEWYHSSSSEHPHNTIDPPSNEPPPPQPNLQGIAHNIAENQEGDNIPLDERLVLQDDGDGDGDDPPPPLAPTPPHAQNLPQPPVPQPNNRDAFQNPPLDQPGPANPRPEHPRPTPANRTIGAKKAKSLARKDQRRAYHEFQRQEAEVRKIQEAAGAEEREAALRAEKERRARITEGIVRKEREEREARKREAERKAEEEIEGRERVIALVRAGAEKGAVNLVEEAWKEGKDRVWVEKLVRASGLLQQLPKDNQRVLITHDGWLVKIDAEIMAKVYADMETLGDNNNGGKVSFEALGAAIGKTVLDRVGAH